MNAYVKFDGLDKLDYKQYSATIKAISKLDDCITVTFDIDNFTIKYILSGPMVEDRFYSIFNLPYRDHSFLIGTFWEVVKARTTNEDFLNIR